MVNRKSVASFAGAVSKTPVSNRRHGLSNRKASAATLAITVGFLLGLAGGIALWLFDKRAGAVPAA